MPAVIGIEHHTALCYIAAQAPPEGWHGQYANMVDEASGNQPIIIVEFGVCADLRFGWFPDENTYANHPLAARGLEPYNAYEVINSSWVRQLTQLEAGNRDRSLRSKRHFILTFHDSSFECVADGYAVRAVTGSIQSAMADALASITAR